MAETKNQRFIVKHVDGVMHLIVAPEGKALAEVPPARTPAAVKTDEKKQ